MNKNKNFLTEKSEAFIFIPPLENLKVNTTFKNLALPFPKAKATHKKHH
jgi:hypothetical protein